MIVGRCVNPDGPFGTIEASTTLSRSVPCTRPEEVDYVAFLGRGHRARPDDVGKGVAVRADHIPQLVGIAFG
jgi:pyrimidine operon attenuation protein/uracil phosphoribosyltransferase